MRQTIVSTPPAPLRPVTQFSTQPFAPDERVAFWNDVVCDHFSPATVSLPADEGRDFSATTLQRSLGPVGMSRVEATPHITRRDGNAVRRKPLDCFFLSYLTHGRGRLRQGGRETVQTAGDILIYSSEEPFEYQWDSSYGGYWLRLPGPLLLGRMPQARAMTARPISTQQPMGRLLGNLIQENYRLELQCPAATMRRVASSLVEVLAAAFEGHAGLDPAQDPRHMNLLDRARSHILANLEDTDLDCDRLCHDLGVSRRTLTRLFAQQGATPISWMWEQRLRQSHELIASGQGVRVTDVAVASGFSNLSHFSRAFKARYGVTAKAMIAARGK